MVEAAARAGVAAAEAEAEAGRCGPRFTLRSAEGAEVVAAAVDVGVVEAEGAGEVEGAEAEDVVEAGLSVSTALEAEEEGAEAEAEVEVEVEVEVEAEEAVERCAVSRLRLLLTRRLLSPAAPLLLVGVEEVVLRLVALRPLSLSRSLV